MLIRKSRNMYIDLVCSYIVEEISTDARYWHTTGLGYLMRDERQFVPCLVECWKWQNFVFLGPKLSDRCKNSINHISAIYVPNYAYISPKYQPYIYTIKTIFQSFEFGKEFKIQIPPFFGFFPLLLHFFMAPLSLLIYSGAKEFYMFRKCLYAFIYTLFIQ